MSEMSWLIRVTSSCWRVESILKSRSSGCVYCADQVGEYCGLIVAVLFDVAVRRLSSVAEKLPPPHGTSCTTPPLNTNAELLIVAPVCPPEIVLVDAFLEFCVCSRDETVGLYTDRMLAKLTSKTCWPIRWTAMSRLFSSARFTASSSVSDTRGPVESGGSTGS